MERVTRTVAGLAHAVEGHHIAYINRVGVLWIYLATKSATAEGFSQS